MFDYSNGDILSLYDAKIKEYIKIKSRNCIRFVGEFESRALPRPDEKNVNHVFKVTDDFISDERFHIKEKSYSAGTYFVVSFKNNTYLYDLFSVSIQEFEKIHERITNGELDGKSAYDLAKELGYEGTLEEWVDSLKGEPGVPGLGVSNVYMTDTGDLWIRYTDDQTFNLGHVRGRDGEKGECGVYVGTEEPQDDSLFWIDPTQQPLKPNVTIEQVQEIVRQALEEVSNGSY